MQPTEVRHIVSDDGETLLSHYRITHKKYGQEIAIPVVDVRDGLGYRLMAMQMNNISSRSRYINYNQYHQSPKKQKHI